MTDWDMLCIVRFYDELNFLNVWLNFFRCLEIHFRVEMTACPLPDVLDNLILSRMGYFTSGEFTRTGVLCQVNCFCILSINARLGLDMYTLMRMIVIQMYSIPICGIDILHYRSDCVQANEMK